MALALDSGFPVASTVATYQATLPTITVDVPSGGRLLVVAVAAESYNGADLRPVTVSGGGLTWTQRAEGTWNAEYPGALSVSIFTAWAPSAISGLVITAARSNGGGDYTAGQVVAWSFSGASSEAAAIGASAALVHGASAAVTPAVTVTPQATGSVVVTMTISGSSTVVTPAASTTPWDASGADAIDGAAMGAGRMKTPATTTQGSAVTVGATGTFSYSGAVALEIKAAAANDTTLGAAISGAPAVAANLTTAIRCAAGIAASALLSASLLSPIGSAAISGAPALTGNLTTAIRMSAAVAAAPAVTASLATTAPISWSCADSIDGAIFDCGPLAGTPDLSPLGRRDTIILAAADSDYITIRWYTLGVTTTPQHLTISTGGPALVATSVMDSVNFDLHLAVSTGVNSTVEYWRFRPTRDGAGYITGWTQMARVVLSSGPAMTSPAIMEVVDGNGVHRLAIHGCHGTESAITVDLGVTSSTAGVTPSSSADFRGVDGGATWTALVTNDPGGHYWTQMSGAAHATTHAMEVVASTADGRGRRWHLTPTGGTWTVGALEVFSASADGASSLRAGDGDVVWHLWGGGGRAHVDRISAAGVRTSDALPDPGGGGAYPAETALTVADDGQVGVVIGPPGQGLTARRWTGSAWQTVATFPSAARLEFSGLARSGKVGSREYLLAAEAQPTRLVAAAFASTAPADVTLAGALGASPALGGALSTGIRLGATLAGAPAAGAELSTGIRCAAALGAAPAVGASLSTAIRLAAGVAGAPALAGQLAGTTPVLRADVRSAPALAAQLSTAIALAAGVAAAPATSAELHTEIALGAALAAAPALAGDMVQPVGLAAAMRGEPAVGAELLTEIRLGASVEGHPALRAAGFGDVAGYCRLGFSAGAPTFKLEASPWRLRLTDGRR